MATTELCVSKLIKLEDNFTVYFLHTGGGAKVLRMVEDQTDWLNLVERTSKTFHWLIFFVKSTDSEKKGPETMNCENQIQTCLH